MRSILADKLGNAVAQLPYLPRALRLVWTAARGWTVAWLLLLLVQGMLPVAVVYLTRVLVDALVAAVDAGGSWEVVRLPLTLALIMAALLLLTELLRAITRWVRTAQSELVQDHVRGLIHERAVAADLGFYESSDYHDRLHRARVDALHRPMALVENLGSLLQNSLTLLAMAAVLAPFGWWVPAALLASTVPALWVVVRFAVRQHRWRLRTTSDQRRTWYYDWLLTSRDTASELRLFGLGNHFRDAFRTLRDRLRGERLRLARAEAVAELAAGGIALVVLGGAMAWMVLRALRGQQSLGELAMFYQAFSQGQRLMRSLLETVGQVYSNSLFLENLFEFLGLESRVVTPDEPQPLSEAAGASVAFRDVTFRYPTSQRPVFENFSLEVPEGSVIALLGANGAGKSTLIKLLCRFYDPDGGCVEIDGRDLRSVDLHELRRLVTVLFQEPVHYSETVHRNVELGDVEAVSPAARVADALTAAGADEVVERLPAGANTLLGTWFAGGAELSVGEWQRIALSRAFLRDARVIVLDEPTSAMDSWSEADWMRRLRRRAKGRTTILITHRLSTAMRADTILVLERGTIIESGSHDELLAVGGRYAEAWASQAR